MALRFYICTQAENRIRHEQNGGMEEETRVHNQKGNHWEEAGAKGVVREKREEKDLL